MLADATRFSFTIGDGSSQSGHVFSLGIARLLLQGKANDGLWLNKITCCEELKFLLILCC